MTAGQFGEVDLDLLADYIGGVLDGTPEASAVAHLIDTNLSWTRAYTSLAPAVGEVRTQLAAWGRQPEPMPADVFDRLDTTLVDQGPLVGGADSRATAATIPDQAPRRRPTAVPETAPRGATKPAGRRRWSRWAGPVTVAAAVVAFAGFGINQVFDDGVADRAESAVSADAAGAPGDAGPPTAAAAQSSAERLVASGTDYTRATIAGSIPKSATTTRVAPRSERQPGFAATGPGPGPTVPGLERLADRAARIACLDAVTADYGAGPLAVDLVDYASFEGAPALVIFFVDRTGERWVWVVGPGCGQPPSAADTRYRIRVG